MLSRIRSDWTSGASSRIGTSDMRGHMSHTACFPFPRQRDALPRRCRADSVNLAEDTFLYKQVAEVSKGM